MFNKRLNCEDMCFTWLKGMQSFNNASWGIYERIRIDVNERVCLSRPDTATEYLKAIHYYNLSRNINENTTVYENLIKWLEYAQYDDEPISGSFPFALVDGHKRYHCDKSIYQNDNGKILLNLIDLYNDTKDIRLFNMAKKLADFWLNIQTDEGYFDNPELTLLQKHPKAPCFVLWMMAAMYACYNTFKDNKYLQAGRKAFSFITNCMIGNRIITSFEIEKTENWRPVSSEQVIAMLCLAIAYKYDKDEELKKLAYKISGFVDKLIDTQTGAIKNCDKTCLSASQNSNEYICDLVYTQSFALNAFIEMYKAFDDEKCLDKAKKLANWLIDIQCKNENYLWNGGWRGSYDLKTKSWSGRCNQNNLIDEGGMYSVYTGWTAIPILFGLLKLDLIEKY